MEKQIKVNSMVKAGINELKAKRSSESFKKCFHFNIFGTFFMPFWKSGSRALILYGMVLKLMSEWMNEWIRLHEKANTWKSK